MASSSSFFSLTTAYTLAALLLCSVVESSDAQSSSSGDCTSLIQKLATCVPFVSDKADSPGAACCSGFKSTVETNATCLCGVVGSTGGLNVTKAFQLPTLCDLKMTKSFQQICPGVTLPPGAGPIPGPSKKTPSRSPEPSAPKTAPSPMSPSSSPKNPTTGSGRPSSPKPSASSLCTPSTLLSLAITGVMAGVHFSN